MKCDIDRDDCCKNCTDRTRACWDTCPAHKMRLARAKNRARTIEKARKDEKFWSYTTTYSIYK